MRGRALLEGVGRGMSFGCAILNGDGRNAEWGYFSLDEFLVLLVGRLGVQVEDGWRMWRFGMVWKGASLTQ